MNRTTAVVISVTLFVIWAWFTYSQFEGKGKRTPLILRPASFW